MIIESHPLDKYIDDFSNLPKLVIKEDYKDIVPSLDEKFFSDKEQQLIDRFHLRNQIVAFRLKLAIDIDKGYLVGNSNRPIEFLRLFKSEEEFNKYLNSDYIKSLAHLDWMDYQLIKEVWSIFNSAEFCLPLGLPTQIKSIGHWWWLIQCEDTRNGMKQVGLLGENPKITGKREYTDFNSKYIDAIDPSKGLNINKILDRSNTGDIKNISASEALEYICFNLINRLLSPKKREFEHGIYQQWVDTKRCFNSAMQKEKNVKGIYLIGDEIFILEKHRKISEKYKSFIWSMKIPDDIPEEFRHILQKNKKNDNEYLEN
jgi:hypothetical protein